MLKKTIILISLLIALAIAMFVFKSKPDETVTPEPQVASSTAVRYTTTKISGDYDEYVHSMSNSLGTMYATTSSVSNPYNSCEEEFSRTKPEIINTNKIDKTNWNTFKENEYGFSMKIPAGWLAIPKDSFYKTMSFNHGDNSIIITRLEPTPSDFRGGITVCDQGEYYSMMVDNHFISRMKEVSISEMGHHPYFHLCMMTDNACDYSLTLGERSYNIEYISYKNQTIDSESLIIMDEVVSTIESFKK